MSTYEELAPIIQSTGITRTQVETYFDSIVEHQSTPVPPEITKQKVLALANIYFEPKGIEKRNGLLRVAKEVGLTVDQCKRIISEIAALKAAFFLLQRQFHITAFAYSNMEYVTVTSVGHGISVGDSVNIFGTTNYNGTYIVDFVTDDTFDILATWAGDDATGTAQREG